MLLPISTLSDWALDRIVEIDLRFPGLAGHYLRASDERRQVIRACLACRRVDDNEVPDYGEFLVRAGHDAILRAAMGVIPCGMRGALARSGSKAHAEGYYRLLQSILSDPETSKIARIVRRLPYLSAEKLEVVQLLPVELRHVRIVTRLDQRLQAVDLISVIDTMQRAGFERRAFIDALLATTGESWGKVVARWTLRLPFPANPIPACDAYRPIRSGAELRRVALVYRNCSRRYLSQALAGNSAFGEFTVGSQSVLLHLEKSEGMWAYSSANGYRNGPIDPTLSTLAEAYAARHGIPARRKANRRDSALVSLQRLGGLQECW